MSSSGSSRSRTPSDSDASSVTSSSSNPPEIWHSLPKSELWESEEEEIKELDEEDVRKCKFIQQLERPGGTRNDISRLMEMAQAGHMDQPAFSGGEQRGLSWEVTVDIRHHTGVETHEVATAQSKKIAKAQCATQAYQKIRTLCLTGPWPEANSLPLGQADSEKTVKQLRVLEEAAEHLQALRAVIREPNVTFIAVDVEAHELDHSVVLEVGLSAAANNTQPWISSAHYIIEETKDIRNGKFVRDNKDDFRFGPSKTVPRQELATKVSDWVQVKVPVGWRVVLVGHSMAGDKKWLQSMGVDVDGISTLVWDVALVEQALTVNHARVKLELMAEKYEVEKPEWRGWHNAGNDARLTLEVMQQQKNMLL